jgi:hypothetical protein
MPLILLAGLALPLAACATSPYGSGYGYGGSQYGALGSIGALGSGYGSGFSQAAVNACAGTASRYGRVSIRQVRQVSSSSVKVWGYASNGYRNEGWDCTFRSDGRITDFDI